MASVHVSIGWEDAAVSGICKTEEIEAYFCYWTEESVSIHLQEFCMQCILQKMFSTPQMEQFHIYPAVATWIVDVEAFDITFTKLM